MDRFAWIFEFCAATGEYGAGFRGGDMWQACLHAGSSRAGDEERGDYWLVAFLGGKEYKILIRYEPGKKGALDCSKFLSALEKAHDCLRVL
jgi:hypothetical protein